MTDFVIITFIQHEDEDGYKQCDQIGRFFGFWATFQSLWQQLIFPILLHSQAIFVKVSKTIIVLVKLFLGDFYRHLAIFLWSHCLLLTHIVGHVLAKYGLDKDFQLVVARKVAV